jgi:ABC-type Fe3+/spermidine/putrescine transport system ATPase subunit/ABC-type sulfate transport system permease component
VTRRVPALLPLLGGLLALYLVAPLLAGVQQASLADWSAVDTAALVDASVVSIASATVAAVIIAIGGVPLGYLLARVPGRMMGALGFVVQLPLALPPLASGVLLLFLVGYSAPIGRLTGGALTDSFAGIVLAEIFVAAPFLIIAARSAFAAIDPVLEGVAATLGRGPLEVFFRVSLPIARPAILSGLLLAWLRAFGEFGATIMVAYHPYSLPVYTYVAFNGQGLPAMLPVLLPTLVLAFAIMLASAAAGMQRVQGEETARPAEEDVPHPPRDVAAAPVCAVTPLDLTLDLEKRLGNFRLAFKWTPRARRLAIIGPSGSGKSMTLKVLAGIESCDQGSALLGGSDLLLLAPAMRGIAYVPQNYGLFPHLTLAEQLQFPRGADPRQAMLWLDRLGLRGLEGRRQEALSLGQQQRAALARALVRPARLLLLDEPFSALDAPLRASLRQQLRALQTRIDAATILVTHDPVEAALLADEILLLEGGRVLQAGPADQVFSRPANETAARLLGAETVAAGVIADATRLVLGADTALRICGPAPAAGSRVGWSVPATRVRLNGAGAYGGSIESVVPAGVGRRVAIRFGEALLYAFAGFDDYRCGAACRFDVDPDAVAIWPLD